MKVKMKLDVQSITRFALEHGEKFAFGLVAVVFLMFVYSALKHEVLDASNQPDKLIALAQQAQAHASEAPFDPKHAGLAVVEYVDRAKREPVDSTKFTATRPFDPPVFDQKSKRDMPKLLPIEQVRAESGFGIFALKAGGAGAAKDQKNAVEAGGAFKPSSEDALVGRPYVVITGLVPLHTQAQEYARAFEGALGEDPKKDQPRYDSCVLERAEIDPKQPDNLQWQKVPSSEEFTSQWATTVPDSIPKELIEKNVVQSLGPLVGGWGEAVGHPGLSGSANADPMQGQGGQPKVRLCRAFDFSVEMHKKYRYRIKAKLENPNYGQHVTYVKDPKTISAETVETDWSNPTDTVVIPDGNGVLTEAIAKDSRDYDPTVVMMITAIDQNEGIEAIKELTVQRASVLDVAAPRAMALNPRDGKLSEIDNVKFSTGIVVVDIHGGQPLSQRRLATLTSPVEVLVRDRQGNLRVRNEFDDQPFVEERKVVEEAAKSEGSEKDAIPSEPSRRRPHGQ